MARLDLRGRTLPLAQAWPRIPHRIRISLEGQVEFEGPLLRVQFGPAQVLSVAPTQEPGMFVLRHQGGQVRFLNQFTGFHEFLGWLVQENPGVDLQGC